MKKITILVQILFLCINLMLLIASIYLILYTLNPDKPVPSAIALFLLGFLIWFLFYLKKSTAFVVPVSFYMTALTSAFPSLLYLTYSLLHPFLIWYFKPFHQGALICQSVAVAVGIGIALFTYLHVIIVLIAFSETDHFKQTD